MESHGSRELSKEWFYDIECYRKATLPLDTAYQFEYNGEEWIANTLNLISRVTSM